MRPLKSFLASFVISIVVYLAGTAFFGPFDSYFTNLFSNIDKMIYAFSFKVINVTGIANP